MRYQDIRRHLKPYSVVSSRTTTINHAFAAIIAPCDAYDPIRIREALRVLGQDPDADLTCAYCGVEAETWDHVHATVRDKAFSGHGHRLGNLLPCCKPCNSKKGNKEWRTFLHILPMQEAVRKEREARIDAYLKTYGVVDSIPLHLPEYRQLQELRLKVLELFAQADGIAISIRDGARATANSE